MAYRSLKQYFDHRVIKNIEGADYGIRIKIQMPSHTLEIPVVCWALVEFYSEERQKNGTVVTAAFVDPLSTIDKDGNAVKLSSLTTLDIFLSRHPDATFITFGGVNVEPIITENNSEFTPDSPE